MSSAALPRLRVLPIDGRLGGEPSAIHRETGEGCSHLPGLAPVDARRRAQKSDYYGFPAPSRLIRPLNNGLQPRRNHVRYMVRR